jgi:DNA-directed RNA polymerase subunit RPC12/RpoP
MNRLEYTRRMDFDELQYEQTVNAGIAAVKGGDFDQARMLLNKATEMKPGDTMPWLWLSAATEDPVEKRDFLEHALAADPGNAAARHGLVLLSDKLDRSRLLEEGETVQLQQTGEPEEARSAEVFCCPTCGGRLNYDPDRQGLLCSSCGYEEVVGKEEAKSAEASEQVLDFILPTTRGHLWTESHHQFSCAQCGAVSLLPPQQTVSECPYCGSNQMIESDEIKELVDPHLIAPAQFGAEKALYHLRSWLGNGWFIPDDLKNLAKTSRLRPAYYPFWTFDGTCQLNWTCEVNEGSSQDPHWVLRDGVEFKMFDDVLVPGLRKVNPEAIKHIEPFKLKELLEFKPEYLAGWTSLTYDLALADASLKAREKVARSMRRDLHSRVMLGQEKRNLQSGGLNWSGMTFKLALLPLWVGTYHYRGKIYRVLINGQSGKVGGEKPSDGLKMVAVILSAVLAALVLGFLIWALGLTFGWFSF